MQDTLEGSPPGGGVYHLRELAVPVSAREPDLAEEIARFLRVKRGRIGRVRVLRKSLDSRRRNRPCWRYTLEFDCEGQLRHPKVRSAGPAAGGAAGEAGGYRPPGPRVAVVGCGPAGMAAAYALARKGYRVEVFEQGGEVRGRFQDIRRFLKGNQFHPRSNILFGEGGAGTFSDGKLTHRTRNAHTEAFLRLLVECGADEDITYLSHPHIGTDRLQFIITALRGKCEELGCRFRFGVEVADLVVAGGRAAGVVADGKTEPCDAVVLAAGHSARPLYARLAAAGVALEARPFSVGVRVEHPQALINRRQFGERFDAGLTGAAEYFLTWKGEGQGMSAYSFCMCPGGVVVPCADADDGIFTNGMSYSNRAGAFANSAVVVPVVPADLPGFGAAGFGAAGPAGAPDVLAGLAFIRALETRAFALGGGDFGFPAQSVAAFLEDRVDAGPLPASSFPKALRPANLRALFPARINQALAEAFRDFDRKLPGFVAQGLLIGPESRTSAPVRILRDAGSLQSVSTSGLFPLGEGAGYSGGIVSSGADGMRLASTWQEWAAGSAAGPGTAASKEGDR